MINATHQPSGIEEKISVRKFMGTPAEIASNEASKRKNRMRTMLDEQERVSTIADALPGTPNE